MAENADREEAAIKLGNVVCDCAILGMTYEEIDEVVKSALQGWYPDITEESA